MAGLDRDELSDSVRILRRVHRTQVTRTNDGSDIRPDSSVYKDRKGEPVSAYRADLIASDATAATELVLDGYDNHGVASLSAEFIRSKNLEIHEDPDPDDPACGHAHVLIVGEKPHPVRVELAESSDWERKPPTQSDDW